MLTNPEKSNDDNQQIANVFEILREIQFGLKCLHQNLLLETWMPPDHLLLICKFMDQLEILHHNLIQSVFRPYDSELIFTAPRFTWTNWGTPCMPMVHLIMAPHPLVKSWPHSAEWVT